jgi:hypothetical protein
MKIIFLDIDGVLNSDKSIDYNAKHVDTHMNKNIYKSLRDYIFKPDAENVYNLNIITQNTNAKIVISSSWRLHGLDHVRTILKDCGVEGEIISDTPYLRGNIRGIEIQKWLDYHTNIDSFVILDDDDDMGLLYGNLIKTDNILGLKNYDAIKAINILNGYKNETN